MTAVPRQASSQVHVVSRLNAWQQYLEVLKSVQRCRFLSTTTCKPLDCVKMTLILNQCHSIHTASLPLNLDNRWEMLMIARCFAVCMITLSLSVVGPAIYAEEPQVDSEILSIQAKIEKVFSEHRAENDFPGVAISFVLADGRTGVVTCGMANVEENIPVTSSDRFLAGSVGKMFVAAVTLQLVENGKLSLDDRVEKWIGDEPWFQRLPNAPELTVRSLLNHTAGLPEYYDQAGIADEIKGNPNREWTPYDRLKYVLDQKPLFAVGEGWSGFRLQASDFSFQVSGFRFGIPEV